MPNEPTSGDSKGAVQGSVASKLRVLRAVCGSAPAGFGGWFGVQRGPAPGVFGVRMSDPVPQPKMPRMVGVTAVQVDAVLQALVSMARSSGVVYVVNQGGVVEVSGSSVSAVGTGDVLRELAARYPVRKGGSRE